MDISDKLEESCRLCDENCDKMYSIFDKNEEGFEMLQLIKECLPIIIYRTDPLSKLICESCYTNVNALYTFKKIAEETADRQKDKLKSSFSIASKKIQINSDSQTIDSENQPADVETDHAETENQSEPKTPSNGPDPEEESVRLFLACSEEPEEGSELKDKGTSTDDLTIYCHRCKQSLLDPSVVNGELELCTDLHKAIVESMAKNKVTTESASEKLLRKRKVVPFYHELEDSLCSSLTEFTHNTEGSQCYEMPSDMEDSMDSDEVQPRLKRRRIIESEDEENENTTNSNTDKGLLVIKKTTEINGNFENLFMDEEEYRYQPLSLMNIVLNFINKQNDPEYEPPDEYSTREIIFPTCNHCGKQFQNYKLIALHEMQHHMEVEIDEKIDNPLPWRDDREDALVRNKWLNYFDENGYGDEDIIINESVTAAEEDDTTSPNTTITEDNNSLLIPVEDKSAGNNGDGVAAAERTLTGNEKIVWENSQPMVNGVYLGDYTKEERKTFYQTLRIQGANKKFCELCRYTFKDNWAIESHYFSSACYYTCRHCGMRFNKQRHKFKEHMDEHKERNDPISEKVYAASKISNIIPKILHLPKPKKVVAQHTPKHFKEENNHSIRVKNFTDKKPFPSNIQIKEEPMEYSPRDVITTQSKTGNQAYFCRKCYKVFFKLDEFNVHSKNCDYNQFPQVRPVVKPAPMNPNNSTTSNKNGEVSPAGRPIRNCAKEIGPYKDEAYLPDSILKEPRTSSSANSNQSFVCFICNIAFPTIYSRNSHMRIHKADAQFMPGIYNSRHVAQQQQPKPQLHHHSQQQNHHQRSSSSSSNNHHSPSQQNYRTPLPQQHYQMGQHSINMDIVKQEPMDMPMEPMVEIHEQEPSSFTSSIGDGAVSITPISKNPKHKPSINPHIMRIVQNNPNISIKPRTPEKVQIQPMPSGSGSSSQMHMSMGVPLADDNRSYKCSSCWEAFANKSHLYFHKKNQCEGSRLPCPFCKKRFGTEAEYSSHIYYSHPE